MAAHNGKVCVKKILKLDCRSSSLPYPNITAQWATIAACRTEMAKQFNFVSRRRLLLVAQLKERLLVHPGPVQGLRERRRQEAGNRGDANQCQPQGRLRVPVEREPRGDEPQEADPFDRVDAHETDVPFTKVTRLPDVSVSRFPSKVYCSPS